MRQELAPVLSNACQHTAIDNSTIGSIIYRAKIRPGVALDAVIAAMGWWSV